MSLINVGLIILSSLNLILAVFIYLRNPKDKINIYFSLGLASIAFWGAGEGLMFIAITPELVAFFGGLTYTFGIFAAFTFLLFSFYFPFAICKLSTPKTIFYLILLSTVIIISFIPGVLIKQGIVGAGVASNDLILNQIGFLTYLAIFLFFFLSSFYNLTRKYLKAEGFAKKQLRSITLSVFVVFLFGLIFDLLIPYFKGEVLGWVGPYATVIIIFAVVYLLFFTETKISIR